MNTNITRRQLADALGISVRSLARWLAELGPYDGRGRPRWRLSPGGGKMLFDPDQVRRLKEALPCPAPSKGSGSTPPARSAPGRRGTPAAPISGSAFSEASALIEQKLARLGRSAGSSARSRTGTAGTVVPLRR